MRGQAHTLEGVVAGILLLTSLVFALQVTAVTPLSASTASQHIENQHQTTADGVLATADDRGALKRAVLFWGDADGDGHRSFHDATHPPYYVDEPPNNAFGDILAGALGNRGLVYNVYVVYQDENGNWLRQRMVFRGAPSDNAVTASRSVPLFDDDVLYDENEEPTAAELGDPSTAFYAPDAAPESGVYNFVRVEVVVWRM